MKTKISELNIGGKIILISVIVAILSLFMTWVDIRITKLSGFQQKGYLVLILYIYPVYKVLKGRNLNKVVGIICGGIAVIGMIAFLLSKSVNVFGTTVNAASTGMYVNILASVILIIGVVKYRQN